MVDIAQPDEVRIEKLRAWLDSKGVDVVQIGTELCCPSPFKEREKRKKEPGYRDDKRRLSVTVVQSGGIPFIRWQCWWSKGKTGKPFGGRSAYAISVLTKTPQIEIAQLLDLAYDEAVEGAEGSMEKVLALISQPERQAETLRIAKAQSAQVIAQPHTIPNTCTGLWDGSPITRGAEALVLARGISAEIGKAYGLYWDCQEQGVVLPWADQGMQIKIFQWWFGDKYRFPKEIPGMMTRSDAIFGLHTWKAGMPMVICEGGFTAMSVCGLALGGSTISAQQVALIVACSPTHIVLALDNDHGGLFGAQGILQALSSVLPYATINPVFCPEGNDWNDYLKKYGREKTMQTLAGRVSTSRIVSPKQAIALQYRGKS